MPERVVVLGAGIGGLVSALELATAGLEVTVVDPALSPGGKMRQVIVGGRAIDAGPTVFTLRPVFEEIFAAAGARLEDHLQFDALSILARHAWDRQESNFDLHADTARSVEAVGRFSGAAEARRFEAFCREGRSLYRHLEGAYIRSERPTLGSMVGNLGAGGLVALSRLGAFASLWRCLGRRFADPRLRQLFARYATYCGSSPWQAPATLMLIAQVEMNGVWAVRGGMHALAQALAELAAQRGVRFEWGFRGTRIECEGEAVRGVHLQQAAPLMGGSSPGGAVDGQAAARAETRRLPADAIVFNGDPQALARGLLGPAVVPAIRVSAPKHRSLSALTWCLNTRVEGFELVRHSVFFQDDYEREFRDIFGRGALPTRPTVYVCAQDRLDGPPINGAGDANAGGIDSERLLCLVNAPAHGDQTRFAGAASTGSLTPDPEEFEACQRQTFQLLQRCGLRLERSPLEAPDSAVVTGPRQFESMFPATGGALYGPATHGWMSVFRRSGAQTPVAGLFLAGGGVHPGPGVPMAALSGRLAARAVMAHLGSTRPWQRAATAGGTSTPSATTGATG